MKYKKRNPRNTLKKSVQKLKPLLDGSSGGYLGIYEDAANEICKLMKWKREDEGKIKEK